MKRRLLLLSLLSSLFISQNSSASTVSETLFNPETLTSLLKHYNSEHQEEINKFLNRLKEQYFQGKTAEQNPSYITISSDNHNTSRDVSFSSITRRLNNNFILIDSHQILYKLNYINIKDKTPSSLVRVAFYIAHHLLNEAYRGGFNIVHNISSIEIDSIAHSSPLKKIETILHSKGYKIIKTDAFSNDGPAAWEE